MPQSQVEATLADLAFTQVSDKVPSLFDHYLGFELITKNDENTRAAGLMGFKIGNELIYVPVLFLNGKIKGTEVLYLKSSDVFTSNTKQWVEFLSSRNPGIMGEAGNPDQLTQVGPAQLRPFTQPPVGMLAKGASDLKDAVTPGATGPSIADRLKPGKVKDLVTVGKTAPPIADKLKPGAIEKELRRPIQTGSPTQTIAKGGSITDEDLDTFRKDAAAVRTDVRWWINPDRANAKVASPTLVEYFQGLDNSDYTALLNTLTTERKDLFEKVSYFYDINELLFPEKRTKVAADTETADGAGEPADSARMVVKFLEREHLTAATDEETKRKVLRDGVLVVDNRKTEDKSTVFNEDYQKRFNGVTETGLYEILNANGNLIRVFVGYHPGQIGRASCRERV